MKAFKILIAACIAMLLFLLGAVSLLAQEYKFSHATYTYMDSDHSSTTTQTVEEDVQIYILERFISVKTPNFYWVDLIKERRVIETDYCIIHILDTDHSVYKLYFCDDALVAIDHIPPVGEPSKFHF